MVCGEPLIYGETAAPSVCTLCGGAGHAYISCPRGHFVCDACHNREALARIEAIARTNASRDPFEIAERMMDLPGLPFLGCQHAYIAAAALMAALRNEGSRPVTQADVDEVFARTGTQAVGGYCGLTGVCGVVPALGACVAVLTGSKCGTDEPQRTTMEAATRVMRAIADLTGPSCCKAYVRGALEAVVPYLREALGIRLPAPGKAKCGVAARHPHGCREKRCPYFPEEPARRDKRSVQLPVVNEAVVAGGGSSMDDRMDRLLARSLELGAAKAKIIDTDSVVVEEWVRWKCLYGCPFHGKDAYHPPCAPDTASTRSVMKEYRKAILLTSDKGKALSEAAVHLEGEAYRAGYYKAFALTALTSGPEGAT